jgi:tetratricopeptide (TPR) repeat protein
MNKVHLVFCLLFISYFSSFAQSKSIKDAYFDFTVNRSEKGNAKSVETSLALLKRSSELTPKQITNVEYHIGRMYEEMGDVENAIPHYENSLKGEPNYFVIHRALGFIYLAKTKPFVAQMNEASKSKDATANAKAFAQYKVLVQKAIPYLEKYQACEPDDETLTIITNLYKSINDMQSIVTLEARLKPLAAKCVSLLEDE